MKIRGHGQAVRRPRGRRGALSLAIDREAAGLEKRLAALAAEIGAGRRVLRERLGAVRGRPA